MLKNRRQLFGLHGPPSLLLNLIPEGGVAVDCGAANGLYSNFMTKRANLVYSFEANPEVYEKLAAGAARSMKTINCALSDNDGEATLRVPIDSLGEASLEQLDRGSEMREVPISTRTLDSFRLERVGFLKVDVEGHEGKLLNGAAETISRCRPVVFIEIEERHVAGAIRNVRDLLIGTHGYQSCSFLLHGRWYPFEEFDLDRHQARYASDPSNADYVSNFCFLP